MNKQTDYFKSNRLIYKLILVMMVAVFCFAAVQAGAAEKSDTNVSKPNSTSGYWTYNSGKGHPVCDDLLNRLNNFNWSRIGDKDERHRCARRLALGYPKFKEVPWRDLEPKKYEELIFRMFRYSSCGAVSGVTDEKPRTCHDTLIRDKTRRYIEEGGRLQVWRTDLLSKYLDGSEGAHTQTVARIFEKVDIDKRANEFCPVEDEVEWTNSLSFIVKDDLSDLDSNLRYYRQHIPMNSHVRSGKAFFCSGKLFYILNAGDAITGIYIDEDKPTTFCSILYKEQKRRK